MKQFSLFVWMIMASSPLLFGQETAPSKKFLVGGGLNIQATKNSTDFDVFGGSQSDTKVFGFSISPYAGKYLNEKWIIGLGIGYGLVAQKTKSSFSGNESKDVISSFGASFFARYLLNPSDKLVFQLAPSVEFDYNVVNEDDGDDKTKNILGGIGIGPVISYAMSNKINLVGRFGSLQFIAGSTKNEDSDDKISYHNFQANFNLRSISLGLEVNL